ncbi:MAG: 50S ribosomal protein L11 methyltransferase [Christensenellales bacterium]|jgi:ribosomal protein L11 methyltransferase
MNYKKISVITDSEGAEIVAALLGDITDGVVIEDKNDFIQGVLNSEYGASDYDLSKDDTVKVEAYIEADKFNGYKYIIERIKALDIQITVNISDYADRDYTSEWKSFHKPIELKKIAIVPEWIEYNADKKSIKINIGSSFGTGQHESTILALKFLEKIPLQGKRVLDLGCGSGILGLAAAALGADSVYMCDKEPVKEALNNIELNGYNNIAAERKELSECDLCGDIVVVNIFAGVIIEHRDKIVSLCGSGGDIILSGLYRDDAEKVRNAFSALKLIESAAIGDWSTLHLRKWN